MSDKKIGVDANSDGIIDFYNADVLTANDFYPFGSQMPGRKYNQPNTKYRYGFNGQEKSEENCGCGNTYSAQFWEYDSRTGRRYNVDPVEDIGISPYATNRNNPILYNDPEGDCPFCPFLFGAFVGAVTEIVEQTVGNITDNISKGNSWNDGLFEKIDWADVGTSSLQGGLMTLPGVGVGAKVISEGVGNYVKSATDVTIEAGQKNVFDNSKSMEDFEKDFVVNSAGSVAGITPVKKATTTVAKVRAKSVIKAVATPILGGIKTGAAETSTKSLLNQPKSDTKSNSNTKPKSSSDKSNKIEWIFIKKRTLNGKPVPTNDTQPYDNEWNEKVRPPKK